jgi:hypothetical protein
MLALAEGEMPVLPKLNPQPSDIISKERQVFLLLQISTLPRGNEPQDLVVEVHGVLGEVEEGGAVRSRRILEV